MTTRRESTRKTWKTKKGTRNFRLLGAWRKKSKLGLEKGERLCLFSDLPLGFRSQKYGCKRRRVP